MEIRFRPDRLKTERMVRAMTQVELATSAGIAAGTYSRIENGLQEPHATTVRRLAVALGITPGMLLIYDAGQVEVR